MKRFTVCARICSFVLLFWLQFSLLSQVVRRNQVGATGDIDALPVLDITKVQLPGNRSPEAKHASAYNQVGRSLLGGKTDADVPNRVGRYQYGANYDSLPTNNADLIIVGTVTREVPHISGDGTSIYSEITISSLTQLKGHGPAPNDQVLAERQGGVIRLPSGKKRLEGVMDRGLPTIGNTYLFFLKNHDGIYSILNGYTYDSGPPKALDAADDNIQAKNGNDLLSQVAAKLRNF